MKTVEIERPTTFTNVHGEFKIVGPKNKKNENDNSEICTGCFYDPKSRKVPGAPCVDKTFCGYLYQYVVPIKLNENGKKLQESTN